MPHRFFPLLMQGYLKGIKAQERFDVKEHPMKRPFSPRVRVKYYERMA